MADNENPDPVEEESGDGPKKKKLIILIAAAVAIIGIGVGAYMVLFSGDSKPSTEETAAEGDTPPDGAEEGSEEAEKEGGAKASETAEKPEGEGKEKSGDDDDEEIQVNFGATYPLKTFRLNLGNPLENRYISMDIALEYKGGAGHKKEIETRMPQLRDAVVNVTSRKTREFLLGPDGKDQLRLEILNRLNQFLERKIEAVYISDMLIE